MHGMSQRVKELGEREQTVQLQGSSKTVNTTSTEISYLEETSELLQELVTFLEETSTDQLPDLGPLPK